MNTSTPFSASKKIIILGIIGLAVFGLIMRLAPHPANFSPVAAIALFAGYYLPKKWAVILPLAILLISDLFIGFYDWRLMLTVYGCIALAGVTGLAIRKSRQFLMIVTSTLLISICFFVLTNFAVWFFSPWYEHSLAGLMLCYTLAVPFFKNTLMGNLFFVGALFGSYELLKLLATSKIRSLLPFTNK